MTIVIVQCRLSSTRLPNKAMMMLGGKPLVRWTLDAMKMVAADGYVLATDEESLETLRPEATASGYEIMSGPLEDVLMRFCLAVKKYSADVVVRATADNPFLFYEAAQSLLDEYNRRECDYITYTSLPHGSGVEVMKAEALLRAATLTKDPYDKEHVGPALYNHKDVFRCVMLSAPQRFSHSSLRTTVDTASDLRRAHLVERVVRQTREGMARYASAPIASNARRSREAGNGAMCGLAVKAGDAPMARDASMGSGGRQEVPYTTEEIVSAFGAPCVKNPVLFVPSIAAGQGTGHLKRCVKAAAQIAGFVLVEPLCAESGEAQDKLPPPVIDGILRSASDFEPWQAVHDIGDKGEYALIAADCFKLGKEEAKLLSDAAAVLDIDDGGDATALCDCLVDIIPSALDRKANIQDSSLIDLPHRVRKGGKAERASDIHKVLVCFGGEDPANLAFTAAEQVRKALIASGSASPSVTAVTMQDRPDSLDESIAVVAPVPLLREILADYDLVVTHYGLTAYEAAAAGCAVLLCATTLLHGKLARKYGFVCLEKKDISSRKMASLCLDAAALYPKVLGADGTVAGSDSDMADDKRVKGEETNRLPLDNGRYALGEEYSLASLIKSAARGRRMNCPVCGAGAASAGNANVGAVAARTREHTYRRCPSCGMIYMSWTMAEAARYDADYFGGQYKAQYGKTYLEDFEAIKAQGARRIREIDRIMHSSRGAVLDIGCAYGPFLAAAHEDKWDVYGTDVSKQAVAYVQSSLLFPASVSHFPDFDAQTEFGISQFDAVTMWYVIEHFQDLDSVLKHLSSLVKAGGVFAFSTPSGEGVSAKMQREKFFAQSPSDHYTIWEPSRAASILKRYGFRVESIVSTGHHADRFPLVQKHGWNASSPLYKAVEGASRIFRMGDTCEVYCRRQSEAGDRG